MQATACLEPITNCDLTDFASLPQRREWLCRLARSGMRLGFPLWLMSCRQSEHVFVEACSAQAMPSGLLASHLAWFTRVLTEPGDTLPVDLRSVCLDPLTPCPMSELGGFGDFVLQDDISERLVLRVVSAPHDVSWSRLDNLISAARPSLKAASAEPVPSRQGLSLRDAASGAYCAEYFLDTLDREISRVRRHGHELAVVVLELSHGDGREWQAAQVHEAVGYHLAESVRQTDVVGRLDGMGYAVVLYGTGARNGLIAADRISAALAADPRVTPGTRYALGVAGCEGGDAMEALGLLGRARQAAKEAAALAPGKAFIYL